MVKQMEQKRMNTRKANIAVRQNSPLLFRGVIAHRKKSDDQKTIGPSSKAGLYALRFFCRNGTFDFACPRNLWCHDGKG